MEDEDNFLSSCTILDMFWLVCPFQHKCFYLSVTLNQCVNHFYWKNLVVYLVSWDCLLGNMYYVYMESLSLLPYWSLLSLKNLVNDWLSEKIIVYSKGIPFFHDLSQRSKMNTASCFFLSVICFRHLLPNEWKLVLFSHLKIIMKDLQAAPMNYRCIVDVTSV